MYQRYNQKRYAQRMESQAEEKGGKPSLAVSVKVKEKRIITDPRGKRTGSQAVREESRVLMKRNLEAALAQGTKKIYERWWRRFCDFCEVRGEVAVQAGPDLVGRFLSVQGEASAGLGGVDQARAAIRLNILLAKPGQSSPTDSPLVQGVIKGMKRRFFKPVSKKAPLSREDLRRLLEEIVGTREDQDIAFKDWRLAAQVSLMFLTFSRFEEAKELTVGQIMEKGQDLVVTFAKGKQYQFGESRTSVMAGNSSRNVRLDPVGVVKLYMRKLKEKGGLGPNQKLFPALTGKMAFEQPASYGAVRSQFKYWVRRAGLSDEVVIILYVDFGDLVVHWGGDVIEQVGWTYHYFCVNLRWESVMNFDVTFLSLGCIL